MDIQIKHTSDVAFQSDVLEATGLVLVDFWADWCAPCKAIAPILQDAAVKYAGRVTIVKLNVDENSTIPQIYGVRGIPFLMLFKDGKAVDNHVEAISRSELDRFIGRQL